MKTWKKYVAESLFIVSYVLIGFYLTRAFRESVFEVEFFRAGLITHILGHYLGGSVLGGRAIWSALQRLGNQPKVLYGAYVLWAAYWAFAAILRYRTLGTFYLDMGIFSQAIASVSRGEFFWTTLAEGIGDSYWADHVNLWIILLSPFYWTQYGNELLLIFQSFALYAPALIWFQFLKKKGLSNAWAVVAFLSWLLHFSIAFNTQWDFHETAFSVVFLSFWVCAFLETNILRVAFWTVCLVLLKETYSVYLFPGVLLLIWKQIRSHRALDRRTGLLFVTALFQCVWFFGVKKLFITVDYFSPGLLSTHRYAQFGDSAKEVFFGILTKPELVWETLTRKDVMSWYRNLLYISGYFTLLSGSLNLIWLPISLVTALASRTLQMQPQYHYLLEILPITFGLGWWVFLREDVAKFRVRYSVIGVWMLLCAFWQPPVDLFGPMSNVRFLSDCVQVEKEARRVVTEEIQSCGGADKVVIYASQGWFSYFTDIHNLYPMDRSERVRPNLESMQDKSIIPCVIRIYMGEPALEDLNTGTVHRLGSCSDVESLVVVEREV